MNSYYTYYTPELIRGTRHLKKKAGLLVYCEETYRTDSKYCTTECDNISGYKFVLYSGNCFMLLLLLCTNLTVSDCQLFVSSLTPVFDKLHNDTNKFFLAFVAII